ncbi:glycosyltransferase family 32 protein [Aeromonas encheleia]|uniref:Uncharacterized protein n=1 Tax=Aeromonas encheleia TaxID=73010 RepID=A0AAE9MDH4_9GAMM|nr:glycosyltransferase [Aeromonas encheleia]USV56434.1 hypothetical protein NHF51_13870 [Aeromonas encheleia]
MKSGFITIQTSKWKLSESAVNISENDILRSEFILRIIQATSSIITPKPTSNIPKVIIQFWDGNDIPKDVQECIKSWQSLKGNGIEHQIFNSTTARKFIENNLCEENVKAFDRCYHPAMKSDYFRLCYIYCNGGFYVDADDVYSGLDISPLFSDHRMKLQPLCYDIDSNAMISPDEFIVSGKATDNRIFYFNNNPIIAPPNHPIVEYALMRSTCLLLEKNEDHLPEIQSTTGPGNISASVVAYLADYESDIRAEHLDIMSKWVDLAKTIWDLSYRHDSRNWRLSNRKNYEQTQSDKMD